MYPPTDRASEVSRLCCPQPISEHDKKKPMMANYVVGLGGRDVSTNMIRQAFDSLIKIKETGKVQEGVRNRPAALYTFTKTKLEDLPLFV